MSDGTKPASHRVILHVDMDAFYVSVELRRRPELVGRPVVVGGDGPRGVVAAASYEARRYGVRSATPSVTARRICPDAVFLPGDYAHYAEVSVQVQQILRSITPVVEPLSLDEAFLDVTGCQRLWGSGPQIASIVRRRTAGELALDCSVGVAPNKFLAKLASVAAKPRVNAAGVRPGAGVVHVPPGGELAFLHPLPVEAMWGVGPATLERLHGLGVRTVAQLADVDESLLVGAIGKAHGSHLFQLAHGIDDRPVEVDRPPKSIGHEETFGTDLHTHDELRVELVRLADGVAARLRAHGTGARTWTLKVRFAGFRTITRSTTLPTPAATAHAVLEAVDPLLRSVDPGPGVRLLGVSGSNLTGSAEQLNLLDGWDSAESTVDAIRQRFGPASIGPASAVSAGKLRLVRRGSQQWGPAQGAD